MANDLSLSAREDEGGISEALEHRSSFSRRYSLSMRSQCWGFLVRTAKPFDKAAWIGCQRSGGRLKSIFVQIEKCLGCRSCELACAVAHSSSGSLYSAINEEPTPVSRIYVEATDSGPLPLQCHHCEDSPCTEACVAGAIWRDETSGTVRVDEERCVRCWTCIMVCPFGAIAGSQERKVVYKCDACEESGEVACVAACPTGALVWSEPENVLSLKRRQRAKNDVLARRVRSRA